ncbi:hypothetical protein DERF_009297 [Dermatophagoides farinae]|uniref:Uncharacterized protein n=1 Tax=Dermatophagoides farinae TaxID=6954 RepID=A0A922L3W0_DERFA|nr:hypothetical protein DERF_009297 [Dermatophagoides farinae]
MNKNLSTIHFEMMNEKFISDFHYFNGIIMANNETVSLLHYYHIEIKNVYIMAKTLFSPKKNL